MNGSIHWSQFHALFCVFCYGIMDLMGVSPPLYGCMTPFWCYASLSLSISLFLLFFWDCRSPYRRRQTFTTAIISSTSFLILSVLLCSTVFYCVLLCSTCCILCLLIFITLFSFVLAVLAKTCISNLAKYIRHATQQQALYGVLGGGMNMNS